MIEAGDFLKPLRARGYGFYSGVPCSFLTPIINAVISDPALRYIGAVNEGEAVAMAAGAWLAGVKSVVLCQNSGLGNAVNPLTSLNTPFRIPCLLIVTRRGAPGVDPEPQHEEMGRITASLLDTMGLGWRAFPQKKEDVAAALDEAEDFCEKHGRPFALIMEKGSVAPDALHEPAFAPRPPGRLVEFYSGDAAPTRAAALRRFLDVTDSAGVVVATTGKCGRELFTLKDCRRHFYVVGSMGLASALGLGLSLNSDVPVRVLDGDGAVLMHMGNLATIGATAPSNYTHLLLDNGVHDSTGGQKTVSPVVDFAKAALACGYKTALRCQGLEGFEQGLRYAQDAPKPLFLHLPIRPGSLSPLGRPTIPPHEAALRLKRFLAGAMRKDAAAGEAQAS